MSGGEMPKAILKERYQLLEREMIETFQAGLKEYRPDLEYPASFSDMQAGVRAIMRNYITERRVFTLDESFFESE